MAQRTGYRIYFDQGYTGADSGDGVSGGLQTLDFDPADYNQSATGTVNYPNTLGDVSGAFYFVDGDYYFVPDNDAGFPPNEAGTVVNTNYSGGNGVVDGTSGSDMIGPHMTSQDVDGDEVDGADGDDDIIYAGGGNDWVDGGEGDDTIDAGSGSDFVDVSDGQDNISLGEGADHVQIIDNQGHDTLDGGAGYDRLDFDQFDGWDVTISEAGTGSYTNDSGASGDFTNFERISGSSGDDTYDASSATQSVDIDSSGGDDTVIGGAGDDILDGEHGSDTIEGGAGRDAIDGGTGDDTLSGGAGDDTLTGGAGNDIFEWNVGDGKDVITDFNSGNSGTLDDGDSTNNDFVDLSGHYDRLSELYADHADDGVLNQSNSTANGGDVDYSDNTQFGSGSMEFRGASADSSSFTQENTGVVCFASGTYIRTPRGDVPIEHLRPGDLVCTQDNGPQPLRWIASRELDRAALKAAPQHAPIHIAKGVLGTNRAMLVSPQHGLLVGPDHLIRAKHLAAHLPGVRIARGKTHVRYIHLLFERHQIIFAEGVPTENFFPGPMALCALSKPARAALFILLPALKTTHARDSYGPTARPFLKRRDLEADPTYWAALTRAPASAIALHA
ncbi:Hint domain-containing protein [Cognatishimia sp. MH4019]|uniref:Hint domain-containing protein n=1 Tax=Cognatishimia sp. MH4019 TaxID=2854030 RepID=UPI001CD2EF01|nr:Hint domain-containing protein [Cognatishimia sp. MH4019]